MAISGELGQAALGSFGLGEAGTAAAIVAPTGIASAQAFGSPYLNTLVGQSVTPTGIGTAAGYGSPALVQGPAQKTLGGNARVSATPITTLGGNAYVTGNTLKRLYGSARVSTTPTKTLGGNARVAGGVLLGGNACVRRTQTPTLGGNARIVSAAAAGGTAGRFFPDPGRRLGEAETGYLSVVYKNYPLAAGTADLAWIMDDTVLPINGIQFEIKEPVKETVIETVGARTLTVVEEELDTPRVTRPRQFTMEFPALGGQVLQFFKRRMRVGKEFYADFRLLDAVGETWETGYTDLSDPLFARKRYWGTLPWWKPGSVQVRVNGVLQSVADGVLAVNPTKGFVEFFTAQDPTATVEIQYVYSPLVKIVAVENNPKAGHAFNRFAPAVTLLELTPLDPAYSETTPIAGTTTTTPPPAGYFDSFNRADGPATNLDTGQAWDRAGSTLGAAKLQVTTNRAAAGAAVGGDNSYTTVTDTADGLVEAKVYKNGAATVPILIGRYGGGDCYRLISEFDGGDSYPTLRLKRLVGGVTTLLWEGGQFDPDAATLGLKFNGQQISVYVNGFRHVTYTDADTTLTANRRFGVIVTTSQIVDDFSFRRLGEVYPGYLPDDPNSDYLTGMPLYDSFNRANNGPGFLDTGQVWLQSNDLAQVAVNGNRISGGSGGLVTVCGNYDGIVEITPGQSTGNANSGVCLMRCTSNLSHFIWAGSDSGNFKILCWNSGAWLALTGGTGAVAWDPTYPMRLRCQGTTATLWAFYSGTWNQVYTGTIPGAWGGSNTSTLHGFNTGSSSNYVDDWKFLPANTMP